MGYILTAGRTSAILFERVQWMGYILTADRTSTIFIWVNIVDGIYINC